MNEHQHAAERIIRDAEEMKSKGKTMTGRMADALRLAEWYIANAKRIEAVPKLIETAGVLADMHDHVRQYRTPEWFQQFAGTVYSGGFGETLPTVAECQAASELVKSLN